MGNDKIDPCQSVSRVQLPRAETEERLAQRRGARLASYQAYVNFGNVYIHTSRSQFIIFRNEGNRPLTLRNFQSSHPVFQLSENFMVIQPGETRMLRITFLPHFGQIYSASISFSSNDPRFSFGNIFLTGQAISD